jgi:murein DD-endopeptidase MepM/ murein hydrolase activator NlpD
MKRKYLNIILLILLQFYIVPGVYSSEKKIDPIKDSYIINSLQMDSDIDLTSPDQEPSEGEILFDDSFFDSSPQKKMPKTAVKPQNILKKMKSTDRRLHFKEHKVKRNENLWTIAKRSDITLKQLIEINNITNPGLLKENDIILVPSRRGIFYTIKRGDTLTAISNRYNTEIDVIAEHNNIDGKKIIAGKKIFLPDAEEPVIRPVILKDPQEKIPAPVERTAMPLNNEKKVQSEKVVLSWPMRGPITSGFGVRTHPFSGDKKFHCGLDIGAEEGTVVRSAGEGRVIFSGWKEAYGNMIVIAHRNNYITIYAHNSKNLVDVNETIKRGQKIALSGKTGAVTGAHLHFEIRKGIVPLNPFRILK